MHALKDPRWIEAMQEELLQFKLQEVWTLVDLPDGKRPIGTKWVFRNKKDERGIVIKNKAGCWELKYHQEELYTHKEEMAFSDSEGIDYVEAQLVTYRKNEVLFSEEVVVLKREVGCKQYEINMLKTEFEKVKQEKEGIDFKIEKFENASKDLDKLLGSQITDNEEFQHPEFEGYGPKDSKNVSTGAPIIKDLESDSNDEKKPKFKVEKKTGVSKTVSPTGNPETDLKDSVRLNSPEDKKMDIKSAFIYGKIEEEVYVCEPPRFEDPDIPNSSIQSRKKHLLDCIKFPKLLYGYLVNLFVGQWISKRKDRQDFVDQKGQK
ncbi:ribonuclease H-like domain-containing protein [Tanacetum coccineum]